MHFESQNSNNIGINDSTPSYTLDVAGDINATGEVRNSGAALTSDERLKENIEDMGSMLSKVMQMRPVQFDWRDGARGGRLAREEYRVNDFGFIAQELSSILPNMVSVGDDSKQLQGVAYSKLVSVLTKAIQELNAKVADLEAKINEPKFTEAGLLEKTNAELRDILAGIPGAGSGSGKTKAELVQMILEAQG